MRDEAVPVDAICRAIQRIPEDVSHHGTTPPDPADIYVVPAHEKALNLDIPIVVGDRGTGKSFWSAALCGPETRLLISRRFRRLSLDSAQVSWGFSAERGCPDHPSRQVLRQLYQKGFSAEEIWRAVILHQLAPVCAQEIPGGNWEERVGFVSEHTEKEEQIISTANRILLEKGKRHLIVFDALDRLADDWAGIRELLQGLLRMCLDLRSLRNIRIKIFIRPDMWEDRSVWTFPDASKLHHSHVVLQWRRVDLYGLFWHWLANSSPEESRTFRNWCSDAQGLQFEPIQAGEGREVYMLPHSLSSDEDIQAGLLQAIASPFMGRDRRRGKTYTWVPTHLADAKGQVSPRSFLLALKRAEEVSRERNAEEILHFEGLKKGVQDASQVRKQELMEDYPWIEQVLDPLKGMTVPCTKEELIRRWEEDQVVDAIRHPGKPADNDKAYLPPHAMEDRLGGQKPEEALIEALIEIGVMNRLSDERLNIPDLFRVAAGIGRKGGVRAIR
jgi:hypothetical protein